MKDTVQTLTVHVKHHFPGCISLLLFKRSVIKCRTSVFGVHVAPHCDVTLNVPLDVGPSERRTHHLVSLVCSFQRPLFVLADRNVDMATPLHHTWTYQALIHDVLVSSHASLMELTHI